MFWVTYDPYFAQKSVSFEADFLYDENIEYSENKKLKIAALNEADFIVKIKFQIKKNAIKSILFASATIILLCHIQISLYWTNAYEGYNGTYVELKRNLIGNFLLVFNKKFHLG